MTKFTVTGPPLIRAYCHCTICQQFNQAPFADITLFRARDVRQPDKALLSFKSYRNPPILMRGKCRHCDEAAIELMRAPLLDLVVVPTGNIRNQSFVPEPRLHVFYDRRVADMTDALPKFEGYLRSQWAFSKRLLAAMWASPT